MAAMPDEQDVLAAFDALYAALAERRDAAEIAAPFAEDEDVTLWGSDEPERAVGRDAIGALLEPIVAAPTPTRFEWDERRVHVEGDAAWVHARGRASARGGTIPYRVTTILVRRDGRWRWHAHSGSSPD